MPRALLVALALALVGCGVHEGDSCEAPRVECTGPSEALACIDGAMRRIPCRGSDACRTDGDGARCDQSIAQEGDACGGGAACSSDHRVFLVCRDGRFAEGAECQAGCIIAGGRASCPGPELRPALQ